MVLALQQYEFCQKEFKSGKWRILDFPNILYLTLQESVETHRQFLMAPSSDQKWSEIMVDVWPIFNTRYYSLLEGLDGGSGSPMWSRYLKSSTNYTADH